MVDPEQRWDGGGPDVEDPGVRYFTVDLHHHLVLFVPYDAVCRGRKKSRGLLIRDASINKLSEIHFQRCTDCNFLS